MSSFYKNAGGMVRPITKEELQREIIARLDRGQTNLNDIDTSKITDMSALFSGFMDRNLSHIDISQWDVSNVRNMENMFDYCDSFNSDISNWDVSNVRNMNGMFYGCVKFNSDLSKWNVSKVEDMNNMFAFCNAFNSDLSKWDVSRVSCMSYMFHSCPVFDSDLSEWWVVSDLVSIYSRFEGTAVRVLPEWYRKRIERAEKCYI